MEELRECPFCGSGTHIEHRRNDYICCDNIATCGMVLLFASGGYCEKNNSITHFNTRYNDNKPIIKAQKRLTIQGDFCVIAQCRNQVCDGVSDACDSKHVYERLRELEDEMEDTND